MTNLRPDAGTKGIGDVICPHGGGQTDGEDEAESHDPRHRLHVRAAVHGIEGTQRVRHANVGWGTVAPRYRRRTVTGKGGDASVDAIARSALQEEGSSLPKEAVASATAQIAQETWRESLA